LQQPQIVHDRCNGCGACFARCPVDALSFQYDARQSEAVQRGEK
jgi:ferredoxin